MGSSILLSASVRDERAGEEPNKQTDEHKVFLSLSPFACKQNAGSCCSFSAILNFRPEREPNLFVCVAAGAQFEQQFARLMSRFAVHFGRAPSRGGAIAQQQLIPLSRGRRRSERETSAANKFSPFLFVFADTRFVRPIRSLAVVFNQVSLRKLFSRTFCSIGHLIALLSLNHNNKPPVVQLERNGRRLLWLREAVASAAGQPSLCPRNIIVRPPPPPQKPDPARVRPFGFESSMGSSRQLEFRPFFTLSENVALKMSAAEWCAPANLVQHFGLHAARPQSVSQIGSRADARRTMLEDNNWG